MHPLPYVDLGSDGSAVDAISGIRYQAKRVEAGYRSTCALLADSSLKCWGGNGAGQAGLDTTESWGSGVNETSANRLSPDLGTDLYPVEIAGSYNYTCAILNNGKMKCWGLDEAYATLGIPAYLDTQIGDGQPANEMGDALQYLNHFRAE